MEGSMSHIARQFTTVPVKFVANTCESQPIDVGFFASGMIQVGAAWTTANLGIKVSPYEADTFVPLYKFETNVLPTYNTTVPVMIITPNASRAYALPPEVKGSRFIRLWSVSNTFGNINQAAERTLYLTLKG
jgi:hypothetical protein